MNILVINTLQAVMMNMMMKKIENLMSWRGWEDVVPEEHEGWTMGWGVVKDRLEGLEEWWMGDEGRNKWRSMHEEYFTD